jgi:hypothetical protein
MKINEGTADRIIRAIVGVGLIIVGAMLSGWARPVLIILGLPLLVTAAMGYCHLYTLLGISTTKKDKPV